MFPTVVPGQGKADLHEGSPFGSFGLANEMQPGLLRGAVGLAGVALNAGTHNVFPRSRPAAVSWGHVIKVQILAVKNLAAVLAGVFIALKNIVTRELHLFFGQAIIDQQQDDSWHPDAEGDGMDEFVVRGRFRQIAPFVEIESAERAILAADDGLGLSLKKERQGAAGGADVNRLP